MLSVIMPAYNEGHHIYANIKRVCHVLESHSFDLVVVDDGSNDNTFSESERACLEGLPVQVVRLETNSGKGKALLHGFPLTSGEMIAFLDADLEIAPEYLLLLMDALNTSGADIAIGVKSDSRFPLFRRLLSAAYSFFVSALFGLQLHDTQTGIKLFRREVLDKAVPRLAIKHFAFDLELLVVADRFNSKIIEYPVPIHYHRQGVWGRIRFQQMIGMLVDTFSIYYRASFWKWLQPGGLTRAWMVAFVFGVLLFGVGIGKIITPLVLQPPFNTAFYFLALQFLPIILRDWLLVLGGGLLIMISLLQLNKILLRAFARRDQGDLAGILHRK